MTEKTPWQMYEDSSSYLASMGFIKNMPQWVKFYQGEQWPTATKATQNFPRPVINIIKMICRNKKAAVLSKSVKLHFSSNNLEADTVKLDRFAEYIVKEIKQEDADARAVDDGDKKGTYIFHYYWDSEARGMNGDKEGAVRVEVIDPLNMRVANPNEPDEQKQKWIMIVSREDLESVMEMADADGKQYVATDESDSAYKEEEQEGTEYVTVLTRYFRKNGEVYFEQSTKGGIIHKSTPLTPQLIDKENAPQGEDDAPEASLPDVPEPNITKTRKFERYPVVVGSWEERDKCIYGIGEVESLIPNQRIINSGIGLQILKLQDEAWGKYIVSDDALDGQEITNEPGQVLTDHSKAGNGIRRLQETSMSGTPMQVIQSLLDATRVVTGSTEVMTGEVIGSNMSGAAIAALQSQAERPNEELQQRFWRVKEKQGLVLEQFFKFYYEGQTFTYKETKKNSGKDETKTDVFNGSEYVNTDFSVVVEAGASASFSEPGDIAMIEKLLDKGLISLEEAVALWPQNALSNRKQLMDVIEARKRGEITQLTQLAEQQQLQLDKAAQMIKSQTATVDKAVTLYQENERLKQLLISLTAEATQKINEANGVIQERTQDAVKMAQMLDSAAKKAVPKSLVTQATK